MYVSIQKNMKSLISSVFVVTLFVCLSVRHASSIKCFDCKTSLNSTSDDECSDKFGNSLIRECQASVCSIVVKTQDNGEGSITRACGSSDLNGTMIDAEGTSTADHGQYTDDGAHVSYYTCTTDLCNWDVSYGHRIRRAFGDFLGDLDSKVPFSNDYDKSDTYVNRRKIQCYKCITNPFDDSDTTCRQNMKPKPCYYGACRIFKFVSQGDDVVIRRCDGPEFYQLAELFPKKKPEYFKNGELSRFGMELSWSTCTTDLCNWGVMNKYQTVILFVSAMLSLSVYCTIF